MRVAGEAYERAPSSAPVSATSWPARLTLTFAARARATRLARAEHEGPLRVQRPFYPEGQDGPCHVYVLHPPGGVVSGDRLALDVTLAPHTSALLTAPGASKLYRARGERDASVHQTFRLGAGALLEWLPHETIVFDGARAHTSTEVVLEADATYAGWELVCLGRPASGERFRAGALRTALSIARDGVPAFGERGRFVGGDVLLEAPWGLAGRPVLASFVVASRQAEDAWVEAVRDALADVESASGLWGVTRVPAGIVLRYVGGSVREARALFERTFAVLRPLYAGRAAVHPRIWST